MTEEAVVSNVFEMDIHRMASLLFLDNGLIAPKCLDWIQWAVDVLTDIFE